MERIAAFEKVSKELFTLGLMKLLKNSGEKIIPEGCMAYDEAWAEDIYENIVMPRRATRGSAGYDIFIPFGIRLKPGETIKIPTGIRARMREDFCLLIMPRSGLGSKFRFQLNNTVGVIDSDYYYSDNEGHIFVPMINDSRDGKELVLGAGNAFAQSIFVSFGITYDDDISDERNGGFGSTG